MRVSIVVVSVTAIIVAPLAACETRDECDPGFVKRDNLCVAAAADAGTGAAADAGDEASPDAGGGASSDAGAFGRACTKSGADSPDCEAPASYCAVQPGSTTGYCTAVDCKANPSVCPANWTCFSVPGLDFCFKP